MTDPVDYGKLIMIKYPLLRKAAANFKAEGSAEDLHSFQAFVKFHNGWLDDYALFMALKNAMSQKPWLEWDKPLKERQEKATGKAKAGPP